MEVGRIYQTKNNGPLKVVEYRGYKDVLVEFIETGYLTVAAKSPIECGYVKDKIRPSVFGVGFMGVGEYSYVEGGKATPCKVTWKSMLERCYCPKYQKRFRAYRGCTVAKEWHNFQNFAKWYYDNLPANSDKVVYQLDKDLRVMGNRIYSPDTCTFLTGKENTILARAKNYKFISPEGELVEVYNLTQFSRDNGLVRENMGKVWRGERPSCQGWTAYKEDQPSP